MYILSCIQYYQQSGIHSQLLKQICVWCFWKYWWFYTYHTAVPHSSVDSVVDLRIGGHRFDPWLGQYSFQGLMIIIATGFILSLTAVRCFDNGYVESSHAVPGKEYCAKYWLKELQETMDRCTGHPDITGILLKTALNTIQSINTYHTGSDSLLDYKILDSNTN